MTLEKLQELYEKHNDKLPPFYRGAKAKFLDAQPLLSYFKLYETMGTDSSLKKLGMVWFADSETGYVIKIENKQAFKRCRFFYTSVFKNKRRGKRYIFGLLPNQKVVLCAIVTHLSAIIDKQSSTTKSFLSRGRAFILSDLKKRKEPILNQWRIDKYVFALTGTGIHANDNVTNWPRVYKMAFMSRQTIN